MKDKLDYENPLIEFLYFDSADIVTASPADGTLGGEGGWQETTDPDGWT